MAQSPAFIPPLFKDFGKAAKDLLFKKQYGSKKSIQATSRVDGGNLTLEASARLPTKKEKSVKGLVGALKIKQKVAGVGKAEIDVDSTNKVKGSFEFTKLNPGTTLKVLGGHQGRPDELHLGAEVHHKQDNIAATVTARHIVDFTNFVGVAVAAGSDGLSVAGGADFDTAHLTTDKCDYKVGAQYAQEEFTASVVCSTTKARDGDSSSKDTDVITGSYVHTFSRHLTLGANMEYKLHDTKPDESQTVFTFGGAYQLQHDVLVKAKANTDYKLEAALEQKLVNPSLKATLGATFDANKREAPLTGYGFALSFGEN